MNALREQFVAAAPLYLAWGGFAIGAIFGFVVQRTNFCAMGSLADIAAFGDYRRFRTWLLATAVAVIGTQCLQHFAVVDLERSMYLGTNINWLGNILGGLLFGVGMVFAGGCASRNLVRLGSGDVRAAVVLLVMGSFAYMTLGGILGPLRAELENLTAVELAEDSSASLATALSQASSIGDASATWLVAAFLAAALVVYCFSDRAFRTSPLHIVGGIVVGLCVVAGWALSGLTYDEFAASPGYAQSLTYVRATGDAMEYLERYTAIVVPGFGTATVFGAIAGGLFGALISGKFRLVGFADSTDTLRNIAGGALMGVGGITALGCTIGQSVTGVSTLAIGSLLAAVAIVFGGFVGLRLLERSLV
jgi:uncharacterized protein